MVNLATDLASNGGWGPGGWWPIFPILWVILWGTLIFVAYRFFRGNRWQRDRSAQDVLSERYARGEINEEEYRKRLSVLKSG